MKKKLLLLGVLPVLGVAMAAQQASEAAFLDQGKLGRFISDIAYTDKNAYNARAQELNIKIAEEGMTLLKNKDNMLPFGAEVKKVSVFGKNSNDMQLGGGGSGAGNVSSGITKIDIHKSLTDVGYEVNGTLKSFYSNSSASGSGKTNGNSGWKGISEATVGETPIGNYTDDVISSFDEYGDAALLVLARGGTEGADCKTYDARDNKNDPISTRHYLELSKNEEDLLDMIEEHFDKVIVLINSGNIFECERFETDDKVTGVIWIGTPGANGCAAIGKFLTGEVSPSGRTVDTWARDFTLDPTYQNFAENSQHNIDPATGKDYPADTMFNADGTPVRSDGSYKGEPTWANEEFGVVNYGLNGVRPSSYVSYEEGVYLDYRYYETMYADLEAVAKGSGDTWYDSERGVVYPFGYGLSYTTFKQELVSCNVAKKQIAKASQTIKAKVKVTNTGDVAGKEVVQLYLKAPYTVGGIEKPYENLCAFAKTDVLKPGESQTLDLSFVLQDFASYDCNDANKNDFKGYELDGGRYELSVNKNAHEVIDSTYFTIPKVGIKYENDRFTGNKVENRFTDAGFYSSLPGEDDVEFTSFSRADMEETFPKFPSIEDRTLKEGSRAEEFLTHAFTLADLELNDDGEYIPLAAKKTKEDIEALGWTQQENGKPLTKEQSIQFEELVGLDIDDELWEEFMNQMTYDEMINYVAGGSQHNPALSRANKPSSSDSDGPSKFGTMWWCGAPIVAATYNIELAKQQGDCIGIEGHIDNKYGWAGPGVNLHRSPFGGRNFEYYSADPFLTGRISGRVVAGATDKGLYCFFKHFAVNDQEKNREGGIAFVDEQALRELYLKPFQMVVQEGKTTGIMSSYNRLGLMETAASYPLLTEVLRDEWGFKGSIISDMTHHGNSAFDAGMYENINNRILAGCNNQLDSQDYKNDMNAKWDNDRGCPTFKSGGQTYDSYSWWYAVRKCAKECLWMCANSGAMQRTFDVEAEGVAFAGVEQGYFATAIGEEVSIKVELPDSYKVGQTYNDKSITSVELAIEDATPLPEGLSFDNGVISGVAEAKYNGFIHLVVKLTLEDETEVNLGASFEMYVAPTIENDTLKADGQMNAAVPIAIAGGSVLVVGLAILGVILLSKKKKTA